MLAGAILALAAVLAYADSLSGPFFFDDAPAIVENPTIRHLGRLGRVLSPPANGSSVSGRPVANLSFALNYAAGGTAVRGYHLANLGIQILAGLLLFGLARRTLVRAGWPDPLKAAFGLALLWMVHPLLTESVTSVVQRTESLMGLFYLLTLYGFARGADSGRPAPWLALSWAACLLGMGTKEVMVTAPLMVLLWDRTFLAGNFRSAWRLRRGYYLALASTWILLLVLVARIGGTRDGAAGFGGGVSPWAYLLTQCRALVLYLRLALWPHPLAIDYGSALVAGLSSVWPQALLLLALLAATLWALARRPALGFLGAWFFVILAPSSSVIPLITQTIAEHRMYLPLAAVLAAVVLAIDRLAGRASLVLFAALAAGLGAMTAGRNRDYRTVVSIWSRDVAVVPSNPRAHYNLGSALESGGAAGPAVAEYREAIRLKPDYAEPHNNLAGILFREGRLEEAAAQYRDAIRFAPANPGMLYNYGNTLVKLGRPAEAVPYFERSLQIRPDDAETHGNYGAALAQLHRWPEAEAQYREALRLNPDYAVAHYDLGNILARTGRMLQAVGEYQEAIRLDPGYASAQANLANALFQLGRVAESIEHYQAALRADPDNPRVRFNLANSLLVLGRAEEARQQYRAVLRLDPGLAQARQMLERLDAARP